MMLCLRRPSTETMRDFLARQSKLGFTYSVAGSTETVPAPGYAVDHARIKLGEGQDVFTRARAALKRWDQFRLGWAEAWPPETPIQAGEVVAVLAHQIGLWWLNACRIAYVVDEAGATNRFGFAYGTLPDHVESGEERFLVEWAQASGEVWYDILAVSRPHQFLARVGYPYTRHVQERFRKDSAAAMLTAVRDDVG